MTQLSGDPRQAQSDPGALTLTCDSLPHAHQTHLLSFGSSNGRSLKQTRQLQLVRRVTGYSLGQGQGGTELGHRAQPGGASQHKESG